MHIVCAGMRRSGSTWLYNATRVLVSMACEGTIWAGFEDTYHHAAADHTVIKAHRFDYRYLFGADAVLTCHRDLRDVAASAIRRGLTKPDPVSVIEYLTKCTRYEFDQYEAARAWPIPYHVIAERPLAAVAQIAQVIGMDHDPELSRRVVAAVAALPIGDKVDPEILLHPDHVTDGGIGTWTRTLGPSTAQAIEAVFFGWLREHGYTVDGVGDP